jgi:hypothetical protein
MALFGHHTSHNLHQHNFHDVRGKGSHHDFINIMGTVVKTGETVSCTVLHHGITHGPAATRSVAVSLA